MNEVVFCDYLRRKNSDLSFLQDEARLCALQVPKRHQDEILSSRERKDMTSFIPKIKKCAARSHAPKNASSLLPRKFLTHKEVCQNRACIFTNDKNAHLVCVLYNMYLRGKTIVSCVLENSNSLRNQADMTIAHEKMSPEQQRIRCAVRAVGDGIERSNFSFIHFKSIRKKRAPIPYMT